jgi:hypothetical protein
MSQLNIDQFEIRVEFERGVGDPTRIFKSMTELIQSTQRLNQHLALSIGVEIQTSLVLQDVEAASLKAILRTILTNISDDILRTGEPKKLLVNSWYLENTKFSIGATREMSLPTGQR